MMTSLNRRALLAGTLATGTMALLDSRLASAATATRFFDARSRPLGLQVYTLGEEAGRDLDATFAQVAAIGYREIELPNLYGRSAGEVRAAADKAGLAIPSMHLAVTTRGPAPGVTLLSPPAEIAHTLGTLGAKHAVAPIALLPEGLRPASGESMQVAIARAFAAAGEDIWKRTAAAVNTAASALKPLGIAVGYHNHNLEFAPIGRTSGWEILMREFEPIVELEVDVGWIATSGLDPADFLKRHKGRVTQLHVKDVAKGNTTNFGLTMKPAEVGAGKLDWARILPAARAAGVRHFYVEQEPPFAIPRIEAARRSHDNLVKLRA